ncbi:hypothetical protein [Nostoc flagelliforme]|uniref:hypothetical protein n=1 Tax=Nostoc flagelliforme TaxID=1306274 RepID=UPI001CEC85A8|nr:hypothetical protein [Nostoc flagelliforme]
MFVKSKGCLNSGKPEQEQFYNVKNFTRDKTNPVPTAANVKIEPLSKQSKQTAVELAFKDAETENYALKNFGVSATTFLNTHWKNLLNSRRMEEDAIVKSGTVASFDRSSVAATSSISSTTNASLVLFFLR